MCSGCSEPTWTESAALGFAAARVLEATMIFTGVVSLLSLVTLQQDLGAAAGANGAALVIAAASHVAVCNWAFLLPNPPDSKPGPPRARPLSAPVRTCATCPGRR
jgi:hypothetical protein